MSSLPMSWSRAAVAVSGGIVTSVWRRSADAAIDVATEWRHRSPSDRPYSGTAFCSRRRALDCTASQRTELVPSRITASRTLLTGLSEPLDAEFALRSSVAVSAWS